MAAHILPPPLRKGDRMTSDEFIRRWEAMPDLSRAELIDGVVHRASPVTDIHADFHFRISSWLTLYVLSTPGCGARTEATWLISNDAVPQPDLALKILPEHGGQSRVEGKYAAGAPELIVEVGYSSSARDAGAKLRLYERSGVREYITVRPVKELLIWRELRDGKFRELAPAPADGLLRSKVFPGLWLDTAALWNNDLPGLAAVVQRGVSSEEHARFVQALSRPKV